MGESKIEWTDATWNPVRGCSLVSPGCTNCYAMRQAHRQKNGAYKGLTRLGPNGPVWTGDVRFVPEILGYPASLKRPHLIFVNSMSDLFHEAVSDEMIDQIFAAMAFARQHQFQVLTKRPERMRDYLKKRELAAGMLLNHVWLGVSCEDQKTANERIPLLIDTPAAVRWVSAEPLLGPIDVHSHAGILIDALDWLVVGGESGPGANPMHPDWVRSLRDQCVAAGVPFFFKQWGQWKPVPFEDGHWPESSSRCTFDTETQLERVRSKHDAGRLLDGREWSQYPDIAMGGA